MHRNTGHKIAYSRVTAQPASEPIILDDAKVFLKVEGTAEDALITRNIVSARQYAENRTGLSLITQTREVKLDYFPLEITLSNGPVQSVVITYQDSSDAEQTLADSEYWVDTHSRIARIVPKSSWPVTKERPNAVTVEYVAGYGDASDVPQRLIDAMYIVLGWMYSNRDQVVPVDLIDHLVSTDVVVQDVSY